MIPGHFSLATNYARVLTGTSDPDSLMQLFTDDVICTYKGEERQGREAVLALFREHILTQKLLSKRISLEPIDDCISVKLHRLLAEDHKAIEIALLTFQQVEENRFQISHVRINHSSPPSPLIPRSATL